MKPLNAKLRRKKWWQFWLPPYYLHLVFEVKEKFLINLLKGGETMEPHKWFWSGSWTSKRLLASLMFMFMWVMTALGKPVATEAWILAGIVMTHGVADALNKKAK